MQTTNRPNEAFAALTRCWVGRNAPFCRMPFRGVRCAHLKKAKRRAWASQLRLFVPLTIPTTRGIFTVVIGRSDHAKRRACG
jgi:hypothetical protein